MPGVPDPGSWSTIDRLAGDPEGRPLEVSDRWGSGETEPALFGELTGHLLLGLYILPLALECFDTLNSSTILRSQSRLPLW
jgi:hypothetical protein